MNKRLVEELIVLAELRILFYEYFAQVFIAPAGSEFIGISSELLPSFIEFAKFRDNDEVRAGLSLLNDFIDVEKSIDLNTYVINLHKEYMQLYLDSDTNICLPYVASKLYNFERLAGFRLSDNHLALELVYLSNLSKQLFFILINENYQKIIGILQEEKCFIDKCLLPWFDGFLSETRMKSAKINSILYKAVAILTYEFLKCNSDLNNDFLNEIQR